MLDANADDVITPDKMLTAAQDYATAGVAIIAKDRVDVADVLLRMNASLSNVAEGHSEARELFEQYDKDGKGYLDSLDLTRFFKHYLPALRHKEIR